MIEAKGAGVRQEWSPEELLANWTLVDGDWDPVANKSGATRLGFSLLLKFFHKDGALTGPDKEHAETSMLALHLLQSALVHVNTLLVQQVLAEPSWSEKLSDQDRRGLTALFWSNVNPYGTFRLDMGKRLDLGPTAAVPLPRTPADAAERSSTQSR